MGNRISIAFKNGNETSITLFSHWDGMGLIEAVKDYVSVMERTRPEGSMLMPLDRREPNTVMLDFITYHLKFPVSSNYYLGKDEHDGDNSDNGHWIFDLQIGDFIYD